MRIRLEKRLLPVLAVGLALWGCAVGLGIRWTSVRGQIRELRAEAYPQVIRFASPQRTEKILPLPPVDTEATCAGLGRRVAGLCRQTGIDSLVYTARLGSGTAIEPAVAAYFRQALGEEEVSGSGEALLRTQEAKLECRTSYTRMRELLERIEQVDPPLGVRRLEIEAEQSALMVRIDLFGLSLEM